MITTGNLAPQVDEEALRAAFIPFGEIKSVELPIDQVTSKEKSERFIFSNSDHPRGFAHIIFEDPDDCEHAIFNMNESEFFGKVITVSYAKPQKKDNSKQAVWKSEEYLRTVV